MCELIIGMTKVLTVCYVNGQRIWKGLRLQSMLDREHRDKLERKSCVMKLPVWKNLEETEGDRIE